MRRVGIAPRDWAVQHAYEGAFAVLWVLLALPALLVRFPPLHDHPNHLARAYLLAHLGQLPELQSHYEIAWLPYPNLAFDLIVAPLCQAMSAPLAGRLFLVLLPGCFLLGADRLARALHGQRSWTALLAGYWFFNTLTLYGFLSYLFGLGLYLLVFSLWLDDRRDPGGGRTRLVLLLVAVPICYLAHATAWFFLAASVVTSLLCATDRARPRTWLRHGALLLPAVLLGLASGVSTFDGSMAWDGPWGKLKGAASLVALYHPGWDLLLALAFVVALVICARGGLTVHRTGLVIAGLFVLGFVLAPSQIGGTWAADRRLLMPAVTLALVSVRFDLTGQRARAACAIALLLVVVRAAEVALAWPALSRDIEQRVALLQEVPRGARVYGFALVDRAAKLTWARQMGLPHLHAYAVTLAGASVNGLFAKPNQQPLRVRVGQGADVKQAPHVDVPPEQVDWHSIFGHHDYVFASRSTAAYREFLGRHCATVAISADAGLYRLCRL
jgi:hypothetical protein